MPSESALEQSRRCQLRSVGYAQPFDWLAKGWWDMLQRPVPALVHGLVVATFGAALLLLAHRQFWLLAGAFSGFLLLAPIAATGLYAVSRAIERGHDATLSTALSIWKPKDHRLVLFGLLLALAGTCWVLTSASMITAFAPQLVNDPVDFLHVVVLNDDSHLFEAWLMLGGVMAAPVYASSVVAIPLMLERRIGVLGAVLTSWRAVMLSPGPMALWAALLIAVTLIGMSTLLIGLVIAVPWLSYASWHAYRDLVAAADLPESA